MKKIIIALLAFVLFAASLNFVLAATPTVCCEKTISGLYCQDVPAAECAADAKQVPTGCKATSYCKPGLCYDSSEGTCLSNTPQLICNLKKGVWTEKNVPQCDLGCCVLGDQAAFVTLTRCKRLSSFLGLETDYRKDLKTEASCIAAVLGQEKGACVYESELQKTCRMTTRAECAGGISGNRTKGEFFKGILCSAEELGTNCGLTENTKCLPGKEEVYFVDSCGNPANIYDADKLNDKEYWTNMKTKDESCDSNEGNGNDGRCGNCNYLLGSFCRATTRGTAQADYGDNICADLNCKTTSNGKSYNHGESWCVYSDKGEIDKGNNAVGSRFYKHICINGEEIVEACDDFRQHVCIEDTISYGDIKFSQAACRVNRWQDCAAQITQKDCENSDRRDCLWKPYGYTVKCVPKNSPGLKFWEGDEAKSICEQASVTCTATCEKDLLGNIECDSDCMDKDGDVSGSWLSQMNDVCQAMGDCVGRDIGTKINWLGDKGYV